MDKEPLHSRVSTRQQLLIISSFLIVLLCGANIEICDISFGMADLVEVLAVIRALVVSKIERTPEQIKKDYFEMEGERIPFAQYGFQSIEDMLRKSGQFVVLTQDDGEIVITAKKSEKDQHMAKLIKETRTKNAAVSDGVFIGLYKIININ